MFRLTRRFCRRLADQRGKISLTVAKKKKVVLGSFFPLASFTFCRESVKKFWRRGTGSAEHGESDAPGGPLLIKKLSGDGGSKKRKSRITLFAYSLANSELDEVFFRSDGVLVVVFMNNVVTQIFFFLS